MLSGFLTKLNIFETERGENLNELCDEILVTLINIAFILEEPANVLVEERRSNLSGFIVNNEALNKVFVDNQYASEEDKFRRFEEMAVAKEKRWRRLKHDEAIDDYKATVSQIKFVNPPKRIRMFGLLRDNMARIHKERVSLI